MKFGNPYAIVTGISKLKGMLRNKTNPGKTDFIIAQKKEGILVRHILLSIHGMCKDPFQQMNIFDKHDYYANSEEC